jgi:tetratricopeptide (TPR) repeat protein
MEEVSGQATMAAKGRGEATLGVFRSLGLGRPPEATKTLLSVRSPHTELQAPCPLHESVEWQLSGIYWHEAGLRPFIENSVPYLVNNSGRLSENAAVLLFENLCEQPPTGEVITVLELGAGSGLFARLFLDAFRAICVDNSRDFYDRLQYVVSDRSPRTVEDWRQRKIFDPYGSHVVSARIDAMEPTTAWLADGRQTTVERPRAVLCNYVLDVLPTTLWRKSASGIEELLLGTRLVDAGAQLALLTPLGLGQIRGCVAGAGGGLRALLPILPLLEVDVHFGPPRPVPRWGEDALHLLASLNEGERIAVNFGALDCLESLWTRLDEGGFVLLNDYGTVGGSDAVCHASPQRFGRTVAVGLNFPLLASGVTSRGRKIVAPSGDDARGVHTRLLSNVDLPRTRAALEARFSRAVESDLEAIVLAARDHAAAGRHSEALDAYRKSLECLPKDWHLLGEIGEFVGLVVRDFQAGLQIAQSALELNPWTSTWLWNVLGDCLYYLDRRQDAHQAFLQAQLIDAEDVRTNLNLAHTFGNLGQPDAALQAIALGFLHDSGVYQARLRECQDQILSGLAVRRAEARDRLARRLERLGG